jgi:hypothetical protein
MPPQKAAASPACGLITIAAGIEEPPSFSDEKAKKAPEA